MAVISAHKTDIGRARQRNEDYVWADERAGVYIVADGLGGHEAGDVASRVAATRVGEMIAGRVGSEAKHLSSGDVRELMTRAIQAASEKVGAAASEAEQEFRMGAVIVVALVCEPVAYISHAGDTRAYLARGSTLTRLTEDDSVVAPLIAAGELSEAEARYDPQRNIVTKMIGQSRPVKPSFRAVGVEPGDWLLLCSDGLWDMVDDRTVLSELEKTDGDPVRATEALTRAANSAGGKDNISVVVIRVLPREGKGGF